MHRAAQQDRSPTSLADPETQARIAQYEMAYRMQTSVPELTDLSKEPAHTFELYGPDAKKPGTFAANCLLARRLAERGVRFIQLYHRDWDHHGKLPVELPKRCKDVDQASAGAHSGSAATGHAGRHIGHLGRRVRTNGVLPGTLNSDRLRPRSSRALLHDVDSGRRHKAGHHDTAKPTITATTSRKIRSMFTICRRPFCTASASTTRNSLTSFKAGTSGLPMSPAKS